MIEGSFWNTMKNIYQNQYWYMKYGTISSEIKEDLSLQLKRLYPMQEKDWKINTETYIKEVTKLQVYNKSFTHWHQWSKSDRVKKIR